MPETLEDFLMKRPPTAEQPLLGQTILVIEDSRFASDALRLLCQRSGARMRRADCLLAAHRHLRSYRPSIVLVDLGLPDGSGLDLIAELSRGDPRVDAIFAMSGDDALADAALAAGADGFLAKPIASVLDFQTAMLGVLPNAARPVGAPITEAAGIVPDTMAMRDDLLRLAAHLEHPGEDTLAYVAGFLGGLAKASGNEVLSDVAFDARALADRVHGPKNHAELRTRLLALVDIGGQGADRALKQL